MSGCVLIDPEERFGSHSESNSYVFIDSSGKHFCVEITTLSIKKRKIPRLQLKDFLVRGISSNLNATPQGCKYNWHRNGPRPHNDKSITIIFLWNFNIKKTTKEYKVNHYSLHRSPKKKGRKGGERGAKPPEFTALFLKK